MERLHVITAVSRPANVPELAQSLIPLAVRWPVCWWLMVDGDAVPAGWVPPPVPPGVQLRSQRGLVPIRTGGQALKNQALDQIDEGWVLILDDDTLVHPALPDCIEGALSQGAQGLIVGQQRNPWQTLLPTLRVGQIDAGQSLFDRALIGDQRLPLAYDGDGQWILRVVRQAPDRVLLTGQIASYYNRLRWEEAPCESLS